MAPLLGPASLLLVLTRMAMAVDGGYASFSPEVSCVLVDGVLGDDGELGYGDCAMVLDDENAVLAESVLGVYREYAMLTDQLGYDEYAKVTDDAALGDDGGLDYDDCAMVLDGEYAMLAEMPTDVSMDHCYGSAVTTTLRGNGIVDGEWFAGTSRDLLLCSIDCPVRHDRCKRKRTWADRLRRKRERRLRLRKAREEEVLRKALRRWAERRRCEQWLLKKNMKAVLSELRDNYVPYERRVRARLLREIRYYGARRAHVVNQLRVCSELRQTYERCRRRFVRAHKSRVLSELRQTYERCRRRFVRAHKSRVLSELRHLARVDDPVDPKKDKDFRHLLREIRFFGEHRHPFQVGGARTKTAKGGRLPSGDRAMTDAERQRKRRVAKAAGSADTTTTKRGRLPSGDRAMTGAERSKKSRGANAAGSADTTTTKRGRLPSGDRAMTGAERKKKSRGTLKTAAHLALLRRVREDLLHGATTPEERRAAADSRHQSNAERRQVDADQRLNRRLEAEEDSEFEAQAHWPPRCPGDEEDLAPSERLGVYYEHLSTTLIERTKTCRNCKQRGPHCSPLDNDGHCPFCSKTPGMFAPSNGLDLDLDPEQQNADGTPRFPKGSEERKIYEELQGLQHEFGDLSPLEELLICPVRAVVPVLYLPSGGQFGYRHNCINFPVDMSTVANQLPRAPRDSGLIIYCEPGKDGKSKITRVRREAIRRWLLFLTRHHEFFRKGIVDDGGKVVVAPVSEAFDDGVLNALPEDGQLGAEDGLDVRDVSKTRDSKAAEEAPAVNTAQLASWLEHGKEPLASHLAAYAREELLLDPAESTQMEQLACKIANVEAGDCHDDKFLLSTIAEFMVATEELVDEESAEERVEEVAAALAAEFTKLGEELGKQADEDGTRARWAGVPVGPTLRGDPCETATADLQRAAGVLEKKADGSTDADAEMMVSAAVDGSKADEAQLDADAEMMVSAEEDGSKADEAPPPPTGNGTRKAPFAVPERGEFPISEYVSDAYVTLAFPTLFPFGKGYFSETRTTPLQPTSYYKHLTNYYDLRFARHTRFPYHSFNTYQRHEANEQGTIYATKELSNMKIADFRQQAKNDPDLHRRLLFYGKTLRNTPPFFAARKKELQAMMQQLGEAHVFATHSHADTHCPYLHKFICHTAQITGTDRDPAEATTEQEGYRRRCKLLQQFPSLVALFFHLKTELYIEHVCVGILGADAYWVRYEWQSRGSTHAHYMLWFKGAPQTYFLDELVREEESKLVAEIPEDAEVDAESFAEKLAERVNERALRELDDDDSPMRTLVDFWTASGTHEASGERVAPRASRDSPLYDSDDQAVNFPAGEPHPSTLEHDCGLSPEQLGEVGAFVCAKCCRHTIHSSYCLRSVNGGEPFCRFHVPHQKRYAANGDELSHHMHVDVVNGKHLRWRLYLKHVDPLMGTTNSYQAQANRSNCDFKVLVDHLSAIEYVTKYVSKAEKPSKSFENVLAEVAETAYKKDMQVGEVEGLVTPTAGSATATACRSFLNKIVASRDLSAQEIAHAQGGCPTTFASHKFMHVSLAEGRPIRTDAAEEPDETQPATTDNKIDLYLDRVGFLREQLEWREEQAENKSRSRFLDEEITPEELEPLDLTTFYRHFEYVGAGRKGGHQLVRRRQPTIILVGPNVPRRKNEEEWARVRLMANMPFRDETDYHSYLNDHGGSHLEAYRRFAESDVAPTHVQRDFKTDVADKLEPEGEEVRGPGDRSEPELADDFASYFADGSADLHSEETLEVVGTTNVDWAARSKARYSAKTIADAETFVRRMSKTVKMATRKCVDPGKLNEEQRRAYSIVEDHVQQLVLSRNKGVFGDRHETPSQLLAMILGTAGTGKSFTLESIVQCIEQTQILADARRLFEPGTLRAIRGFFSTQLRRQQRRTPGTSLVLPTGNCIVANILDFLGLPAFGVIGKDIPRTAVYLPLARRLPLVSAPTGVASRNLATIKGRTIHSLTMPPRKNVRRPNIEFTKNHKTLLNLCKIWKDVDYLIVDEMSMIGRRMLGHVDSRLRQIKGNDLPFGGINVILVGDQGQLPPVKDKVPYTPMDRRSDHPNNYERNGSVLYRFFRTVVYLRRIMRVSGSDQVVEDFRDLQLRLRDGELTEADWDFFKQRGLDVRSSPSFRERFSGADVVHLFTRRDDRNKENDSKIRDAITSGADAAVIKAINSSKLAEISDDEDIEDIPNQLILTVGARVMITHNVWAAGGLCNGTRGIVHDMIFNEENISMPVAVLVRVAATDFDGPSFIEALPGEKIVPITPQNYDFYATNAQGNEEACTRTQLPLTLSWAMTVHKSQGLTLGRVVVHAGTDEHEVGLLFVALSRVKHPDDLAFAPAPGLDRITTCISRKNALKLRRLQEKVLEGYASETATRVSRGVPSWVAPAGPLLPPLLPPPASSSSSSEKKSSSKRKSSSEKKCPKAPPRPRIAKATEDALSQLRHDQTGHLPAALAELQRDGKKTTHWAWWAFPTAKCGDNQPGPPSYVTPASAALLLADAPDVWRQVLEKTVELIADRGIADVLPNADFGRVRAFVTFWNKHNNTVPWLFRVTAALGGALGMKQRTKRPATGEPLPDEKAAKKPAVASAKVKSDVAGNSDDDPVFVKTKRGPTLAELRRATRQMQVDAHREQLRLITAAQLTSPLTLPPGLRQPTEVLTLPASQWNLSMKIVDFLARDRECDHVRTVANWARDALGFDVAVETGAQQIGVSCGMVAANVTAKFLSAGWDFLSVTAESLRSCTVESEIRRGYNGIGLTAETIASRGMDALQDWECSGGTCMIRNDEVCDALVDVYLGTDDVSVRFDGSNVCSLDFGLRKVAEAYAAARSDSRYPLLRTRLTTHPRRYRMSRPQALIFNSKDSRSEGLHWFAVVFSIRRRQLPQEQGT